MNEDIRQLSAEYYAERSQLDHVLLATSGGAIYFTINKSRIPCTDGLCLVEIGC